MSKPWKAELRLLALATLLVLAGGLLSGQMSTFVIVGLSIVLCHHLYWLLRLLHLLHHGKKIESSLPSGLWQELFGEVQRLKTRNRKRKRRLSRFITLFNSAAAALPEAIIMLGRNGEVEWCNPAADGLLGVPWPRAVGQVIGQLIGDPILEEYLLTGEFQYPLEIASPLDKSKVLSVNLYPFGKKHQRLLVARDITRVYLLDQARRDFVANASHELRTPLTVITGYLEILENTPDNQAGQAQSMRLMQEQAKRMQDIINELMMLSRLEMDDLRKPGKPIAVADMLAAILKEAQALSGPEAHVLSLDADPEVWLQGDAGELHSAFSNLIFNAIIHTPPRTEVQVRWHADEQGAHLCVRDTGPGIPARHLPRLTERFYRVDKARSRQAGGTGLGLAITKHALQHHRGELQIFSKPGHGSTFTCHFPPETVVIP